MTTPTIRAARPADLAAVQSLLTHADLPLDGVPSDLAHFFVAEREGEVVGVIGLEPYGDAALLRSAVVAPSTRGSGIGERLVRTLLDEARRHHMHQVILLTTTAEAWFPRFGFHTVSRDAVPDSVKQSMEFMSACPASATVMTLAL
ncbi:MAG: arsenic resistance N-acetyltransferase ArsN2 [Gemmatimonadaceae bacterium]